MFGVGQGSHRSVVASDSIQALQAPCSRETLSCDMVTFRSAAVFFDVGPLPYIPVGSSLHYRTPEEGSLTVTPTNPSVPPPYTRFLLPSEGEMLRNARECARARVRALCTLCTRECKRRRKCTLEMKEKKCSCGAGLALKGNERGGEKKQTAGFSVSRFMAMMFLAELYKHHHQLL